MIFNPWITAPFCPLITIGPDGVSPEEVPVPARATVVGEFPELLLTASVPVAVPEVVGVNVTLRARLALGVSVTGSVAPLYANGPEVEIEVIETEPELLLFVNVTVCLVLMLPTASFPKLSDVGFANSCPAGAVPAPLSATSVGEVSALLTNDKVPVTLPEVVGAKTTVIIPDPPAATEIGRDSPTAPNPAPIKFAAVMERAALPLFEMVRDCLPVLPTLTLPNARLPGCTEICDCIWTPAPESESGSGEVGALLIRLMLLV